MAWEHLSINKPHLVYIILGGFTSLFMLCSSVIKERLYIGEATVATVCGIIFGPHGANLINPMTWGNTDQITLEFSRIVLVVQCFAVGVELPRAYMEKHWRSVTLLLVPVMTFGWLVTSLFIWAVFHSWLNWLECLCVAACVTATDPVLASSVVGKGKFAKRIPKHLRDLLSSESGSNDGMAFPFVYLAIYIIRYGPKADPVALHWFCYTILYECLFGAFYGFVVGYIARRLIRLAHEREWIDRESFLVFYFVLALFCAGSGALLGLDDLLVGFAAGVGFSNDGWFTEKTEESHVSNVIDLLINLSFFVYFGSIIPWDQFNARHSGLDLWRLVVIAVLVLFFRRLPIMLALKPIIPDLKTWREALFAGHFGPIGVGAIFIAILARAELETEDTTPLAVLPEPPFPHLNVIELIWPITTFLVITSIVVHGSSIAVFTLGKRINTLTLTISYTKDGEEPSWTDRLPRIQSHSRSQMSKFSESSIDERAPPSALVGASSGQVFRRQDAQSAPGRPLDGSSSRYQPRGRANGDSENDSGGRSGQSTMKQQISTTAIPSERNAQSSEVLREREGEFCSIPEGKVKQKNDADPNHARSEQKRDAVHGKANSNVPEVKSTLAETERAQNGRQKGSRASQGEDVAKQGSDRVQQQEDQVSDRSIVTTEPVHMAEKGVHGKQSQTKETSSRNWLGTLRGLGNAGGSRVGGRTFSGEGNYHTRGIENHAPGCAYQFGNTIIVEDQDGEVIKKYDLPVSGDGGHHAETKHRPADIGKRLSAVKHHTHAVSSTARHLAEEDEEQDDEARLRFTAGGRRMCRAEFIQSIQDLDRKRRAQVVESRNAPEMVKKEFLKEAHEHAPHQRGLDRHEAPLEPDAAQTSEGATLQRAHSDELASLHLTCSNDQRIPMHEASQDVCAYHLQSSKGENAADGQRREALQRRNQGPDPQEEQTSYSATGAAELSDHTLKTPELNEQSNRDNETAVERRRRESALGLRNGSDSDSEEDGLPRRPPQRRRVRFADDL